MTDIECLTNLLHYNDLMDIRAYINDANDQWYPHYKKEKKKIRMVPASMVHGSVSQRLVVMHEHNHFYLRTSCASMFNEFLIIS